MENEKETFYYSPRACRICKEQMTYKGLGEYECKNCGIKEYDDYGMVRNYLDEHGNATIPEVERETGVSQRTIRKLLKEERFDISKNSKTFLKCERCGADITTGRYCMKCAMEVRKQKEQPKNHHSSIAGFGKTSSDEEGAIRFKREK